MKRAKVITRPSTLPVFYQQEPFDHAGHEQKADSESANEVSEMRMLENLQIALFFSRAQSEMAKQQGQ